MLGVNNGLEAHSILSHFESRKTCLAVLIRTRMYSCTIDPSRQWVAHITGQIATETHNDLVSGLKAKSNLIGGRRLTRAPNRIENNLC